MKGAGGGMLGKDRKGLVLCGLVGFWIVLGPMLAPSHPHLHPHQQLIITSIIIVHDAYTFHDHHGEHITDYQSIPRRD